MLKSCGTDGVDSGGLPPLHNTDDVRDFIFGDMVGVGRWMTFEEVVYISFYLESMRRVAIVNVRSELNCKFFGECCCFVVVRVNLTAGAQQGANRFSFTCQGPSRMPDFFVV